MKHSEPPQPAATAATLWKHRYEALRQLAIGGRQVLESDPLGLVLLRREGVAGWMRCWSELAQPAPAQPVPPPRPVEAAVGWQGQLTQVLAQMSLAHLPNSAAL